MYGEASGDEVSPEGTGSMAVTSTSSGSETMQKNINAAGVFASVGLLLVACAVPVGIHKEEQTKTLVYPQTRKIDHVDDYFGIKISDPYRWMEDIDSGETKNWIREQQQLSERYFANLPIRERITARVQSLYNYEKYSLPFKERERFFYFKNEGLQNQAVLYVHDTVDAEPRVLLDPNGFSPDGTVALTQAVVSPDARLLVYGLSDAGSDWQEWRFRDIDSGKDIQDHLKWIKFSTAAWAKDSSGIYYSRYAAPMQGQVLEQQNYHQKLYFHRLGTSQDKDLLVYENPDNKEWGYTAEVTEDGRYLLITISEGTDQRNRFYYSELGEGHENVVKLLDDFDAEYTFIGNIKNIFYFKTDLDAPSGRIIAIDIRKPQSRYWKQIVPEHAATPIAGVSMINHQLVIRYIQDVLSVVSVFNLDGTKVRDISLPGLGNVQGFGGKINDAETYFVFSSYIQPPTLYRYDFNAGMYEVFQKPQLDFNPEDFVSEQVFYVSKDGTRIPMMISYKKGLQKNSRNPALLYAYGGFSISITPGFNPAYIAWMEMGGIYAVPNLRGGAEYGEKWHQAGMFEKKQNVFDDFYSAAEYLIAQGYTSTESLGIYGRSNGGLLVGAAITQRPELFAVAVPSVGVMDMLRFHKFTIGWAWVSEYGSSDNAGQFAYLVKYSPLHNIRNRDYPATLVMTADHDDRVVPSHSFKFGAALQEQQRGEKPVIIRIETRAGHGAGKPTAMKISEISDMFAFLIANMKFNIHQSPDA